MRTNSHIWDRSPRGAAEDQRLRRGTRRHAPQGPGAADRSRTKPAQDRCWSFKTATKDRPASRYTTRTELNRRHRDFQARDVGGSL